MHQAIKSCVSFDVDAHVVEVWKEVSMKHEELPWIALSNAKILKASFTSFTSPRRYTAWPWTSFERHIQDGWCGGRSDSGATWWCCIAAPCPPPELPDWAGNVAKSGNTVLYPQHDVRE